MTSKIMNYLRYKNQYRIPSSRLKNWDYSSSGWYYVTICVKNRICSLGKIRNRKIYLSDFGKIVVDEWLKTKQIRPNIDLDEYSMMPNHIHGIIIIKYLVETSRRDVSTNKKFLRPNSLGSIIGQFKSITTKLIRKSGYKNFSWQSRFYDHIIRDEQSLSKIREYIRNNHLNWDTDEENPKNIKKV